MASGLVPTQGRGRGLGRDGGGVLSLLKGCGCKGFLS